MKKKKGFTLIELLVTIAVLSLVFIVVGAIVLNVIEPGKEKATKITWSSIKEIALAYTLESDNNIFWTNDDTGDFTCTTVNYLIRKGYLKNNLVNAETNEKIKTDTLLKISRDQNKVSSVSTDSNDTDSCDNQSIEFNIKVDGPSISLGGIAWYYDDDENGIETTVEITDVKAGFSGVKSYDFKILRNSNSKTFSDNSKIVLSELSVDSILYGNGVSVCGWITNNHGVRFPADDVGICTSKFNVDFTTPNKPTIQVCPNGKNSTCSSIDSNKWYGANAVLKISGGGDSPSGIYYKYTVNDVEAPRPSVTDKISYIENLETSATFKVKTFNNVGKESEEVVTSLKIDANSPSINVEPLSQDWETSKTLKVSIGDNESGLAGYQVNNSDKPTSSWINKTGKTFEFSNIVTKVGEYYVHVKDKADNVNTVGPILVENIDTTAPGCTNTPHYTGWTSVERTVEWGCRDNEYGSGCDPEHSGSSININTSKEKHTFDAYTICDLAENCYSCPSKTINVYVDKSQPTAPVLTASDNANIKSGGSHPSSFDLIVSGGGTSISGIYYEYRVNSDSIYTRVTNNEISDITNSGHIYYVRTCNNAGTCSTESEYKVLIEKVPDSPVLTTSDNVPSGGWHKSSSFTLYVDKDIERTGITYKYYYETEYNTQTSEKPLSNKKTTVKSYNGYIKVFVRACLSNNTSNCSGYAEYIINYDTTTPYAPLAEASDGIFSNLWHNASFDLTISPYSSSSISPSGIYYKYTLNGGPEIKLEVDANNKAYIKNISSSGTYKFWTCNNAGTCSDVNSSSLYKASEYVAAIDIDDPVISNIRFSNNFDIVKELTVKAHFFDATSYIKKYKITTESTYTEDGWTSMSTSENDFDLEFTIKSNGTYYIWAEDPAGNRSKSSIIVGNIDNQGPVCTGGFLVVNNSNNYVDIRSVTCTDNDSPPVQLYYLAKTNSTTPDASEISSEVSKFDSSCGKTYYGFVKAIDDIGNYTIYYVGDISSDACPEPIDACCNGSCLGVTHEWPTKTRRSAGYFSSGGAYMIVTNYPSHICTELGYSYLCGCYR